MKSRDFFTVKNDTTDISLQAKDFLTDAVAFDLLSGVNAYVGYYKPFRQFFMEFDTLNIVSTSLTFEYYNGTTWTVLEEVRDETQNFIKSGFIYFDVPSDWAAVDVSGDEQFYIRVRPADDLTTGTSLKGLAILFSNDLDLEGVKTNIVSKLNDGASWIEKHEVAKKLIIQKLRNVGHVIARPVDEADPIIEANTYFDSITEFDLLKPFELREAAKFYALSMIYLDELSDNQEDKYFRSGNRHAIRAEEALNLFMLKVDLNDDGKEDTGENAGSTGTSLHWS